MRTLTTEKDELINAELSKSCLEQNLQRPEYFSSSDSILFLANRTRQYGAVYTVLRLSSEPRACCICTTLFICGKHLNLSLLLYSCPLSFEYFLVVISWIFRKTSSLIILILLYHFPSDIGPSRQNGEKTMQNSSKLSLVNFYSPFLFHVKEFPFIMDSSPGASVVQSAWRLPTVCATQRSEFKLL